MRRLNAGDIHEGMPVLGIDGALLGSVHDIRMTALGRQRDLSLKDCDPGQMIVPPAVTRTAAPMWEVDSFLLSREGGSSEQEIRLFASAIWFLFPGQSVTVDCTRDERNSTPLLGRSALLPAVVGVAGNAKMTH